MTNQYIDSFFAENVYGNAEEEKQMLKNIITKYPLLSELCQNPILLQSVCESYPRMISLAQSCFELVDQSYIYPILTNLLIPYLVNNKKVTQRQLLNFLDEDVYDVAENEIACLEHFSLIPYLNSEHKIEDSLRYIKDTSLSNLQSTKLLTEDGVIVHYLLRDFFAAQCLAKYLSATYGKKNKNYGHKFSDFGVSLDNFIKNEISKDRRYAQVYKFLKQLVEKTYRDAEAKFAELC